MITLRFVRAVAGSSDRLPDAQPAVQRCHVADAGDRALMREHLAAPVEPGVRLCSLGPMPRGIDDGLLQHSQGQASQAIVQSLGGPCIAGWKVNVNVRLHPE